MRVKTHLLAGAIAVALVPMANADPNTGWYIGVEGGANRVNDNSATFSTTLPTSGPAQLTFDDGWAALATAGYAFPGHWRLEGELGYRHNNVKSISGAVNSTRGELDTASLMGNVLYDIPVTQRLTASIGAGAGVVHEEFDDGTLDQDEEVKFAYQGIAGLNYSLSAGTELTLNYRYLRAAESEFHGRHLAHADSYNTDNIDNQTITIGLRFDLQRDATRESYVAPTVDTPPPPMASAAPPPPRQFLVFFGFNKSNLTADAQGVIASAASAAKEFGSASVKVVGHADTVGSDKYNQHLSENRSHAVKAALVNEGIEPGKITATGEGETQLLVQTADNVKEPQNRRASIDLQ
ncbi:MAG: OmpA family protein [Micropepsaceae bacterium]